MYFLFLLNQTPTFFFSSTLHLPDWIWFWILLFGSSQTGLESWLFCSLDITADDRILYFWFFYCQAGQYFYILLSLIALTREFLWFNRKYRADSVFHLSQFLLDRSREWIVAFKIITEADGLTVSYIWKNAKQMRILDYGVIVFWDS